MHEGPELHRFTFYLVLFLCLGMLSVFVTAPGTSKKRWLPPMASSVAFFVFVLITVFETERKHYWAGLVTIIIGAPLCGLIAYGIAASAKFCEKCGAMDYTPNTLWVPPDSCTFCGSKRNGLKPSREPDRLE